MSTRPSAARYASALFDVALKESNPEQAERELTAFADLVRSHADLQKVLLNPAIPAANKRTVVHQILERMQPSMVVGKLLVLLAERDRLELLPDLVTVFHERVMEHLKVIDAEVTTAAPLSPCVLIFSLCPCQGGAIPLPAATCPFPMLQSFDLMVNSACPVFSIPGATSATGVYSITFPASTAPFRFSVQGAVINTCGTVLLTQAYDVMI